MSDNAKGIHEIRAEILRIADELGRMPKRDEFLARTQLRGTKDRIDRLFGSWSGALAAIKLDPGPKPPARDSFSRGKFKYIQPMRDGTLFQRTAQLDLAELFRKAGNPEFLTLVAMPDVHAKHADPWALNCFLEFIALNRIDLFLCLGDFLDAGGITHWPSDSLDPKRFIPEVLKARELRGVISSLLTKTVWRGFLEGNHEDWIRQFLVQGANPQFFDGIEEIGYDFSTQAILDLRKDSWEFFPLNQLLRIGQATFTHGLYTGTNHAKKHLDSVKASIFYGHNHDSKAFADVSLHGPAIAQSLCCLCDLNPKFLRGLLNNWEHGFGLFHFFPDGTFIHTVPKILNGRTIIDGKLYRA